MEGFSVEVVSEVVGYGEVGYPGLVVDSVVDSDTEVEVEGFSVEVVG